VTTGDDYVHGNTVTTRIDEVKTFTSPSPLRRRPV
jgi:hypothetical protein